MGVSRSPLLPLVRSDTQLAVLTALFCGAEDELMISELAERVGLPLSSIAREVHRLEAADVVRVRKRGRTQFASANRDLSWAGPLTDLLDRTSGPAAILAAAFAGVRHIAAVWIFGSWAARSHGVAGSTPHDIDVIVVGQPSALAVTRAARDAERRIGVPVNAIVVDPEEWSAPEDGSFLAHIRAEPLVQVAVESMSRG